MTRFALASPEPLEAEILTTLEAEILTTLEAEILTTLEVKKLSSLEVKMIYDLPTNFPGIGEAPLVTKLLFPESGIAVEGTFRLNEFAVLPQEQLEFLRLYIKVRGNLKEVERVMGISYPTVRARFDGLLRQLGYEADSSDDKSDVLSALERGELTPDEALERLKKA